MLYSKVMKQFLLGFLVLVMLTPALACTCPSDALASTHQEAGHHHDGGDHHGKDKSKDCAEASPQITAQAATLHAPDLKKDVLVFAWADEKPRWSPTLASDHAIRGPPFGSDPPSKLPVFLTTQRLRI